MSRHYRVTWENDVWQDTPQAAAEECLRIQRDPESTAVVFEVVDVLTGVREQVDLQESDGMTLAEARERAGCGTLSDLTRERFGSPRTLRREQFPSPAETLRRKEHRADPAG